MITPQQALQRTIEHREIFFDEMLDLMRQIMRGEISPLMTAAILTGLGVNELSMTASDVPAVKAMLRAGSHAAMQELAVKALACTSFEQVKALGSAA
jgi:anthranilate phosphoribosyltransferase